MNAPTTEIPAEVRDRVKKIVVDVLLEVHHALERGRELDIREASGGRYEADEWNHKADAVSAATELLEKFRGLCTAKGIDADEELRAMGFVMPELSPAAQKWLAVPRSGPKASDPRKAKRRPKPVDMKALENITPEPKHWLVPGWIPRRALSLITGDPGLGKSTLTCELAARVSRGEPIFSAEVGPPANVVLISLEDDPADTIRPRLDAAGADCSKVWIFSIPEDGYSRPPSFPRDLEVLAQVLEELRPSLVIFDPLSALLDGSVSMHRDQDVRGVFAPIAKLAQDFDTAIVFVRHMNKGSGEGPALYRGMGSIALTGAARSELLVARDPRDPKARVLKVIKTNAGADDMSAKRFRLSPIGEVTRIEWLGDADYTASELLTEPSAEEQGATFEASEWLRSELESSPGYARLAKDLLREAKEHGIAERTLQRARERLGVTKRKLPAGWEWSITPSQ